MESSLIGDRIMDFMEQYNSITAQTKKELAAGTIEIIGNFFYEFCMPNLWHLRNIKRSNNEFVFYWVSDTQQAVCPECKTVSQNRANTYLTRRIQDLPISGMTVYHEIKDNRYYCDTPECSSITFIEQFEEMAEKDARLSERLKDFIVRYAIEASSNASSKALIKIGIKVSRDTILRLIKKKGAAVVTQNLKRDDVKVLSVDDINLRKGNSSTACSVFIDGETHRVLVIVQGATEEIAQKVLKQFPSADIVSRDRGTAYASAATKCDKIQVADGFHLVQNIHKVVKDALYQEIPHDLFVREGEGWIRMVNSASEESVDTSVQDDGDCLVVMGPTTLAEDDLEKRIYLAELTDKQADKYKKTMKILELTESGLRTSEIAKRLSMTGQDVWNYRKNAPETIQNVENKIDEYYQYYEQRQYRQKTIAKHTDAIIK
ncbi:MAG: transposase family protein [Clostridia bacterium]|uniref:transposase family protein n=1 Tax=Desulfosporosinus sp. TaxID=157907 RepID=UPI00231D7E59|nr:transposase family protein [Desulfosporosinus sp.]MDA8212381.1 transposase family protein [Clostridia bacterium]